MRRLLPALLLLALLVPATSAQARVPRGWLGVGVGPEYVARYSSLSAEFKRMRKAGVQTARIAVYWSKMQRNGPRKTNFRKTDRVVTAAANARVQLLPVVLDAPPWATADPNRPIHTPRDPADYAKFLTSLVNRYGPAGRFFKNHPKVRRVPIRAWQIWNEVSNPWYWDFNYAAEYPRTLKAAYDAIKAVDAGARVIQAGLNSGGAGTSWDAQEALYREYDREGLGRPFDQIAVHVYTSRVSDALKVVRKTRDVAARYGDAARPIYVSELAWPAARGKLRDEHGHKREFFAATTDKGMAKRLSKGIPLLARHRKDLGIAGVDWFQWVSAYKGTDDAFRYSGLRRIVRKRVVDQPAMKAFRKVAQKLRG
jgi:hypothetical protein